MTESEAVIAYNNDPVKKAQQLRFSTARLLVLLHLSHVVVVVR